MLPSRPVRPPSLQAQLPDTAEDCGTAGGCSALDLLVHNPQADLSAMFEMFVEASTFHIHILKLLATAL